MLHRHPRPPGHPKFPANTRSAHQPLEPLFDGPIVIQIDYETVHAIPHHVRHSALACGHNGHARRMSLRHNVRGGINE